MCPSSDYNLYISGFERGWGISPFYSGLSLYSPGVQMCVKYDHVLNVEQIYIPGQPLWSIFKQFWSGNLC